MERSRRQLFNNGAEHESNHENKVAGEILKDKRNTALVTFSFLR